METVLDPYLFGLVPESLLPIGGVIVFVAVLSWWLGGRVHEALLDIAMASIFDGKKDI